MFDLPFVDNPFKVDDRQLTRRFRKLQQTIHPDAWSAKGKVHVNFGTNFECSVLTKILGLDTQAETSAAADLSSLVNHAFKTLQNPVLRAEYILREQGVDLAESEETLEDPGLLMEVMESREALDEATSQEQVDVIVSETQGPFHLRWSALRLDTGVCRYDERDDAGGRRTVRETPMGGATDLCHQTTLPTEYPRRRKGMGSFVIEGVEI